MKNMKVRVKLTVGFLAITLFAVAIGAAGILGMLQMSAAATDIYENQTQPLAYLSNLTTYLQRMRVGMREYTIGVAANDMNQIESARTTIADINTEMTKNFDLYAPTMQSQEIIKLFNEARGLYDGEYQTHLQQSYTYAKAGDLAGCIQALNDAKNITSTIVSNLDSCMGIQIQAASDTNKGTDVLSQTLLLVIILITIAALVAAAFFAVYISQLICNPLIVLTAFMKKAGTTGDISLRPEDMANIEKYAQIKDEIGQCIGSTASFVQHMTVISKELEEVAEGDLTIQVELLSPNDTMGQSLKKMADNLNNMFGEINASTAQVSTGSKQIADGAQALAQGATQQAATVEELSSSISEIAEKTKGNAEMANKAARLADVIKGNAEKGSHQMDEMMSAVREINQASQDINKVIKVIDDIAFQTNILALNAAVEAARAGQHGKGFAVVAEEVRNLAAKSADAAKNTGGLITNSMEKAELGARIAGETAASLAEIVSGINESSLLVGEIARSSEEQSAGIMQVNNGIDQVAQVVQQNSATAEQSAAASEEMSGQANMLESLMAQFKLKDSPAHFQQRGIPHNGKAQKRHFVPPETASYVPVGTDNGFGKY